MRWRLKSPASSLFAQPFIQTQIKESIKAPRHWPLCGEFTGDRWIPRPKASNAENVSISWRHHVISMKETITTHYSNVTWASRCLKSPANLLFVQQMVQAYTKTSSDLLVIGVGNPPVTDGFPSQRASTAENVSMPWRCHSTVLKDNLWQCTAVITMITTVA